MSGLGSLHLGSSGGGSAPRVSATFNATTSTLSGQVTNPVGSVAGLTVSVFVDGATTATATATTASDGSWSTTLSGLSAGQHSFVASAAVPVTGTTSGIVTVTAALHSTVFAFGLMGAATN